jgi:cytochrome c
MQKQKHPMTWIATGALALAGTTAHAQDAAAGKTAFAQCAACHSIDGSNGAGPSLQGVVGRKAGSFPGFRYSRAMKAVAYSWDASSLDAYIANPQTAVPGNVMPFSGVADAKQRADLIAYLTTLK